MKLLKDLGIALLIAVALVFIPFQVLSPEITAETPLPSHED